MSAELYPQFMRVAIEEAKKAKLEGALPFGAAVVCGEQLVGKGKCEDSTTGDVTDHAEIIALREACRTLGRNNLNDCVIYCTNEPCIMCAAAIFQAKIPKIVVGLSRTDLPHLLRQRRILLTDLAADSGYDIEIITGFLKEEILSVFADAVRK